MNATKHPFIVIVTLVAIIALGTYGYMVIEGWDFHESLYMTMITLTTVGYGEVHELSYAGRYYTIVLLTLSFGTVAYLASAAMSGLVNNFIQRDQKKMERKLRFLENHTIILGFGRMGKRICEELAAANLKFVVMEKSKELVDALRRTPYLWLEGDAAEDKDLIKCNIRKARCLVCVVDNDADGLYAALAARALNDKLYIIIRAESESSRKKILKAGADRVILPYTLTAQKIAQSIIDPAVEDIMEVTSGIQGQYQTELKVLDFMVKADSEYRDKRLADCGFTREGMLVIGLKKRDRQFMFDPPKDIIVEEGDTVVTMFTDQSYLGQRE